MSRRSKILSTVLVACALTGLGFAGAGAQANGEGSDVGEDSAAGVQRRANLSGAEQVAEAHRIQTQGQQSSRRVSGMLDDSRRANDIILVSCLDDKLTQINANLRSVNDRVDALEEAVSSSDDSRRNHEFTVITVLGNKFTVLVQDAERCISQDIFETGATQVTTEIDPASQTEENPTEMPGGATPVTPHVPPPMSGAI